MSRVAPGKPTSIILVLTLIALLTAPVILAGCADNSPQGAVGQLLNAWQSMDWNAYKKAVIPSERNLQKDLEELAKQKFQQVQVKFTDIKTKTTFDEKDKNKATVILDGGKMTINAKILGESKKETRDVLKMPKEERTFQTQKVDGVWYVNIKLG
jgi:hypothetical protein